MGILIVVWVLNFFISVWNAYAVGMSWAEAKIHGGFMRALAWSGAVMSACGFTWCYLVVLTIGGEASGYLDEQMGRAVFELGYLIIILPILGSGLAIWAESLAAAWRERNIWSVGRAGWNTFAQAYDTYQAIKAVPEFVSDLTDFFSDRKGDNGKGSAARIVVLLAVFAVIGGIITTASIIRLSARTSVGHVMRQARASA